MEIIFKQRENSHPIRFTNSGRVFESTLEVTPLVVFPGFAVNLFFVNLYVAFWAFGRPTPALQALENILQVRAKIGEYSDKSKKSNGKCIASLMAGLYRYNGN